jgi:hypothetical protein
MAIIIFWDMALCSVEVYQRFTGRLSFHARRRENLKFHIMK